MFIFASTIFSLDVIPLNIFPAFLIQMCTWPLFMGLGIIATSLFVFFGKGAGFVGAIAGLLNVVAGVYFPTSVFPEPLHKFLSVFSPFNLLLDETRRLLVHGWSSQSLHLIFIFLIAGAIVLPLSVLLFRIALERHRKRGASLFYFG
jgi:ABC-type polysaccharide/polyol phosphate export permease